MNQKNNVLAFIWDFDGTIVDSRLKNFNVTKKIINDILGTEAKNFPVLNSLDSYHSAHTRVVNWRAFYGDSFNMNDEQVNEAGRLWTEYQLNDNTPVQLLNGVKKTIRALNKFPQGIVSQNSRNNIISYLKSQNIYEYFQTVVGYEEVHINKQKPHPDGLLLCLERLVDSQSGCIFYIGDHETDVQSVLNANDVLTEINRKLKIFSVGAFYGFGIDPADWKCRPDYEIKSAEKLISMIDDFQRGKQ
jgi:HAD superfamily hydrolase (TIGR01549 family)